MVKVQRITRCWVSGCDVPVSEQGPCMLHRKEEEEWTTLRAQNARLREALRGLLHAYERQMRDEFDFPGDPWTPERDDNTECLAARRALGEG